jgi:hypothetical protein
MKRIYQKISTLVCLLAIAIGLSGCVEYRTGINFQALNYGEIVQQIRIGEQLNSFSQDAVNNWKDSIEKRVKELSGKIDKLADNTLEITIPFDNAKDLKNKIEAYFDLSLPEHKTTNQGVKSQLQVKQNNFLILVRNHLTGDIDLRSLTAKSADPKVSIASGSQVDLSLSLQTPWGSQSQAESGSLPAIAEKQERATVWQLQPGNLNHIDAIFWLPNPLGIGAIIITGISIAGYYFKYRQLPGIN